MFRLIQQGDVSLETLGPLLEERLSIALWVWNIETDEMKWSKGLYSLLGIQVDAAAPSYALMERAIHVDDRRPQSEIQQALRESVTVDREIRVIMPDRRVRWIRSQISPVVNSSGFPFRAIGICSDITSHRETLHFHRLTANRFSALCKTSGSVYWTMTPDGRHAEMLNSSAAGARQGADLRSLMQTGARDQFDEIVATSFPLRTPFRMTVSLQLDGGAYRKHWSRVMPIVNEKGDIQEWLGVSQDPLAARTAFVEMKEPSLITGAQMRGARAILRWSVAELAAASNVSPAVIRRLEDIEGAAPAEAAHEPIQHALCEAGVEFIFDCDGKPGVRPV